MTLLGRGALRHSLLSSLFGSGGSSAGAAWVVAARAAHHPRALGEAEALLQRLPGATRSRVVAVLDAVAAEEASAAGIAAGAARIREAIPGFVDPSSESSGLEPAIQALILGGQAVLKGRLVSVGQAIAAAPDLDAAVALVREARALRDLDRWADAAFLEEADFGLGGELYVRAARTLDGRPPL